MLMASAKENPSLKRKRCDAVTVLTIVAFAQFVELQNAFKY